MKVWIPSRWLQHSLSGEPTTMVASIYKCVSWRHSAISVTELILSYSDSKLKMRLGYVNVNIKRHSCRKKMKKTAAGRGLYWVLAISDWTLARFGWNVHWYWTKNWCYAGLDWISNGLFKTLVFRTVHLTSWNIQISFLLCHNQNRNSYQWKENSSQMGTSPRRTDWLKYERIENRKCSLSIPGGRN